MSVLLWATSGLAQAPSAERPQPPSGKAAPANRAKAEAPPGKPAGAAEARERGQAKGAPGAGKAETPRSAAPGARPGKGPTGDADNRPKHRGGAGAAAREARAKALDAYREALRAARETTAKDGAEDTDGPAHDKAVEEARKKLLEAHRKGPRARMSPKRLADRDQKLEKALEEARSSREERRKERLAKLEKAHGEKLENPALHNELLRHAWRVARLERVIQIAEATRRTRLVAKAQELLEKENEKHEARLAQLAKAPAGKNAPTPSGKVPPKETAKPAAKADAAPAKPAANAQAASPAATKGNE